MTNKVLSVLVYNHSGVLARVSSLFARRGFNIDSLTVSATNDPEISRITISVRGDAQVIDQILSQTFKLDEDGILPGRGQEPVSRAAAG